MTQLVLLRHGESEANAAQVWQGRADGPMTWQGERQAEEVAKRLAGQTWDLVVSSPLRRAMATAGSVSAQYESDDDLLEVDLGEWDGLPFATVLNEHGQDLLAILAGADNRYGARGEKPSQVAGRMRKALDRIAGAVGPDGRALVVSHGGAIDSVVAGLLAGPGSIRTVGLVSNASLTVLNLREGRWRLQTLNDTDHLGLPSPEVRKRTADGDPVLAIFRHGQTAANVNGVWQGQTCWGLDEVGEQQADRLAGWYGTLDRVYTSRLPRALETARRLTLAEPVPVDGLEEIGMGLWEGLTVEEIKERWAELFEAIFKKRQDLARGETGESWQTMSDRFRKAIDGLDLPPGRVTGVVAHGAAIRAYLTSLSGGDWHLASNLETPFNTSVSHIAFTGRGPLILDYNIAPHLEG